MAHLPVNHPARSVYRPVALGIGASSLWFGLAGWLATDGQPAFDRTETWVLGLRTNPALSLLSAVVGALLVLAGMLGRNLDHFVELAAGVAFLATGLAMLALLRTDANLLNFSMRNAIAWLVAGLVLLAAGLYSKTGPPVRARAEEQFRHGEVGPEHELVPTSFVDKHLEPEPALQSTPDDQRSPG